MNRIATGFGILFLAMPWMSVIAGPSSQQQQGAQPGNVINISVSRTVPTVNYMSRGSTKVDFVGTALLPRAQGEAKVQAKSGVVNIDAKFDGLPDSATFGPAYLVYVLWAITPEGRAANLGQLVLDGTKSKLLVTTRLQTFGMIVTAEPYFAVSFPSEDVVLANTIRSDTKGAVAPVQANFELLQRGKYAGMNLTPLAFDPNVPLDLLQARNAVRIAQLEGAEKYAPDSFAKAREALTRAEAYQTQKQKKSVPQTAREAVQAAEDARTISVKRQEDERIANQQRAAADQAAQAKAAQEAEAQQRAQAEQQKAAAELQKAAAERAAAQEAEARAEAEKAQAEAKKRERPHRLTHNARKRQPHKPNVTSKICAQSCLSNSTVSCLRAIPHADWLSTWATSCSTLASPTSAPPRGKHWRDLPASSRTIPPSISISRGTRTAPALWISIRRCPRSVPMQSATT